jgi:hypothetical protein
MKICDLISELQRFNPNDDVGVEIAPEDLFISKLTGTHPETDLFSIHSVASNNGGDRRVCKIILDPDA